MSNKMIQKYVAIIEKYNEIIEKSDQAGIPPILKQSMERTVNCLEEIKSLRNEYS